MLVDFDVNYNNGNDAFSQRLGVRSHLSLSISVILDINYTINDFN